MSDLPELPAGEMDFLTRILSKDAKNYHVWSYRQWLVRHFGLWPDVSGQEVEPGAADVTASVSRQWIVRLWSAPVEDTESA